MLPIANLLVGCLQANMALRSAETDLLGTQTNQLGANVGKLGNKMAAL